MSSSFTLSSDPEFPVRDRDGIYRSIIGRVGGTKDSPREVKHGFIQEDNVLLEINPNPASSCNEFIKNHQLLMQEVQSLLEPLDLSIAIEASVEYLKGELENPIAKKAGCDPDYNAWTLFQNDPPNLSETNLRSAAGHLHVGFDWANDDIMNRAYLVRVFDLTGVIPSLVLDPDTRRRSLYGMAGCHRPKAIAYGDMYDGVEIRGLSNFWLKNKDLMRWVYSAVEMAFERFDEINKLYEDSTFSEHIIQTINNQDNTEAHNLCKKYSLLLDF